MKFSLPIILILFFLFPWSIKGQQGQAYRAEIFEGDTLPVVKLAPVYIVSMKKFKSKKEQRKYSRLVRYVKKVYPYAKLAGKKLQEYDTLLKNAKTDRERTKLMKRAEKELRNEYEGKLRKFTIGQGKILVKLIDRETSHTSYELLKLLRSGFYASVWQGLGKLFSYDLKVHYDPKGADRKIEQIVRLIEAGVI